MSKLIRQPSSGSFEVSTGVAVRDGQLNLSRLDQKQSLFALRKRAGILSVLRFFSKALGILLIGFAVTWITPGLLDSMSQRTLHRAAVHSDRTSVQTRVVANFATPTTLVYRDINGTRHLILADETRLNRFVNDTLVYLESQRSTIKTKTERKIDALLDNAFFDSHDSITRYADWYFEWGRSWYLLKEALVGTIKGLAPNSVQGFSEAARNEVEAYLIRNYQRFVLKPELRNPVIEAGVARILAESHNQYLDTLTAIEERVQIFLNTYTRHLEVMNDLGPLDVSVDWDAQKWKAPRYSLDDEAFKAAYRATSFIAVSGLIAGTIGPTIERAIAEVFTVTASRVVVSLQPQILGLVVGTVAEPGAGSAAGWFIGAGGALIADYVFNWQRERLGRTEFEAANADALKATKVEYSRALQRDLFRAIDVWFDDTRAIVAEQRLVRKDAPRS
jgi:hypothetical protein